MDDINSNMKHLQLGSFALLGASRTGIALAFHLDKAGFEPLFLWNRSQAGLDRVKDVVRFQKTSTNLAQISNGVEWIIIAVTDDAIPEVARQLSNQLTNDSTTKVFHISGARDAGLLACLKEKGCRIGSFHPLLSVPDIKTGIREIPDTVFSCEGEMKDDLQKIAAKIAAGGITVSSNQKAFIHIAAVFVNNYQTVMIQTLKKAASQLDIDSGVLEKMVQKLSWQALEKAWTESQKDSLTGPAIRGDLNTIDQHLKQLEFFPELQTLYRQYLELTRKLIGDKNKSEI